MVGTVEEVDDAGCVGVIIFRMSSNVESETNTGGSVYVGVGAVGAVGTVGAVVGTVGVPWTVTEADAGVSVVSLRFIGVCPKYKTPASISGRSLLVNTSPLTFNK